MREFKKLVLIRLWNNYLFLLDRSCLEGSNSKTSYFFFINLSPFDCTRSGLGHLLESKELMTKTINSVLLIVSIRKSYDLFTCTANIAAEVLMRVIPVMSLMGILTTRERLSES